jgi:peptidoglycan/LPS O-acetylase OafA/YrhL
VNAFLPPPTDMTAPQPKTAPGRLSGLESARGFAALTIVLFHVCYIPPLEVSAAVKEVFQHFGVGVPLFYAISAFSLFVGYEKSLDRPEGLKKFFLRRFFRIAPLFYVMLVIWLLIGKFHFHSGGKGRDWLVNASFVFGLLPGKHEGIVWASWSIGVEWIFYALFPLFLVLARTRGAATVLFVVGMLISINTPALLSGVATAAPSYLYMCFLTQLAFFCAGVLAYRIVRPCPGGEGAGGPPARRWISWLLAVGALVWLAAAWFTPLKPVVERAYLGVHWPAFACIALLVAAHRGLPWVLDNPVWRYAGRLSFGLYLTNPPVIYGLFKAGAFAWLYDHAPSAATGFLACILVSLALVGLAAQLAFTLVEQPGIHLGERLYQRMLKPVAPAVPGANGAP